MKKLITAVSMALAVCGFAGVANAAGTWSPVGAITLANPGNLDVQKGLVLMCGVSGTATVDASGNASIDPLSLDPGDAGCAVIGFNTTTPFVLDGLAGDVVVIRNVLVEGITGDCAGDLTGSIDQTTGVISFASASIPATVMGEPPCIVDGAITTSPAASYTP